MALPIGGKGIGFFVAAAVVADVVVDFAAAASLRALLAAAVVAPAAGNFGAVVVFVALTMIGLTPVVEVVVLVVAVTVLVTATGFVATTGDVAVGVVTFGFEVALTVFAVVTAETFCFFAVTGVAELVAFVFVEVVGCCVFVTLAGFVTGRGVAARSWAGV